MEAEGKDDRIAARRARIAQRLADAQNAGQVVKETKVVSALEPDPHKSIAKITADLEELDMQREQGIEKVTLVRITADAAESKRRKEEEQAKLERRRKLEEDHVVSARLFEQIIEKWDDALSKSEAGELRDALDAQRKACAELTTRKDTLITQLQGELKTADDNFVKDLRTQTQDIDALLGFMEEQIKSLSGDYKKKLKEIEDTFMAERTELLEAARKEWEDAMEHRRQLEIKFLETSLNRADVQDIELEKLRALNAEEYASMKSALEQEIQKLEQQVQQLRATCLLNSEKLEYNHQVLKKRDEENTVTITQQKRKITRLQDQLNQLKGKLDRQERAFKDDNEALTEDYLRITEQFRDLQRKFRHFQAVDQRQYEEVWDMSEETVHELARKLLDADRVIHEQQLGLGWVPPVDTVLVSQRAPPASTAKKASEALADVMSADAGELSAGAVKRALALLCDEAGFLVEDKLTALLAPLQPDEQRMVRLDAIFKALGVETEADMKRLASYFVRNRDGRETLISADEATAALRRFVEESRKSKGLDGLEAVEEAGTRNASFWSDILTALPDSHLSTWRLLLDALQKYEKTLLERGRLIADTKGLQQQNEELRTLLRQYMGAKVNDELQIPPTKYMPPV